MQPVRYSTKVRLPQRRADVLRRPRLVEFLHESVDKRLILLVAAAGYGKTTLLVDFAHDVDLPVCWYSLDATDTDPRAFFDYLILAMRQQFPGFGAQTEALLASLPDVTREINSVVASLVNDIQNDISDYFLLVLDDFHWVEDADAISSAIDLLVYYLPENCHLVISSRALPHLSFARLAAIRQIAGLGTGDLRFTPDEVTRLLRDNYKVALPGPQAEEIIAASEGWITGILLTTHTLWMGLVESMVRAKGATSPLFDYLADEAYEQQASDVQRFLLCSSILDQMNPDLCDRLFAGGTARDMLQQLTRDNLFIEQLDSPGEWYRYHNLFQSFLRAKLRSEDPDLYERMERGAAKLALEEGDWERAFSHFADAGAEADAASLVERVGENVLDTGRWQTLHRWLDGLPPSTIEANPKLGLLKGRTCLWAGEHDQALSLLTRSAELFRGMGVPEGAGGSLTLKAVGLRVRGRFADAIASCTEALELQGGAENRVAAEAYRDIGICLASQGRLADASVELEKALRIYEAISDRSGAATIAETMGIVSVRLGDLAKGMAFYNRALSTWRGLGKAPSIGNVLNSIGMVYCYTGEYTEAQRILEEALDAVRDGSHLRTEAAVLGSLAHVRRDSGNLPAAQEGYEAALELAHRGDDPQQICYTLDGLANTHRLLGDYATAERLLRQAIQQAEDAEIRYDLAGLRISEGILAEEQGDLARSEKTLRAAIEQLSSAGGLRDLARARFHLARTLYARGRKGLAASELEGSFELCQRLGYDQFMVSEGERADAFFTWALSKGIGGRRLELVVERHQRAAERRKVVKRPQIRIQQQSLPKIKAYSFGKGEVFVDSHLVSSTEWAVEKTKELFFFLLQRSESLRKEQIVDDLWPDADLGKSNSQFHSTMYRLRRATFAQSVAYKDGRYRLTLGKGYWYDVEEFARLIDEARSSDAETRDIVKTYDEAFALYRGPFLEEFYSDWVFPIRDALEERYVRALGDCARLRAGAGEYEPALSLLRTALATDPFQEDAHYYSIQYAALLGDRTAALRHYRDYVELLRDELGAKPSRSVSTLADLIASGKPVPAPDASDL
ncbi:MAG TPA: tetratricopeptide repeat protein [Chloroflexota bacterium]